MAQSKSGRQIFQDVVADACACGPVLGVAIDELKAMDCKNSTIITLEVTNGAGADVFMILGTPLGNPNESANYATFLASIGTVATEAPTDALITDNQGAGATFIKAINQRFQRNPIFVNDIQVVTDDDVQRQESIQVVEVPYNSASDSRLRRREFIPVDTEWTGSVIASQGAILGEFHGIVYKLKDTITTQFNIYIAAHGVTNFRDCNAK